MELLSFFYFLPQLQPKSSVALVVFVGRLLNKPPSTNNKCNMPVVPL